MSIVQAVFYTVQCDSCGAFLDLDGEEYRPTREEAEQIALDHGWRKAEDRLFCDEYPEPAS